MRRHRPVSGRLIGCLGFAFFASYAAAQTTALNEWTWMGGKTNLPTPPSTCWLGSYGKKGVPAPGNSPGGRENSSTWTDRNGNLWLFGGLGCDGNDLWEFNPSSNEWTWIGGSGSEGAGQRGVYGKLRVPAPGNTPGSRTGASTWTDGNGNLWLFGGEGSDADGNGGDLNDLWEFNPSTKLWAWMAGSSTGPNYVTSYPPVYGQPGTYGALGTPGAGNTPGGRYGATSWTDGDGNLWLFGGYGYGANQDIANSNRFIGQVYLDDLWKFNPVTNLWVWMGGSSVIESCNLFGCGLPGVYGTRGTAGAGNFPGSRMNAAGWTDSSGNLWLFGGYGWGSSSANKPFVDPGNLGDLWEFNPFSNEWTWMGGSTALEAPGVFGALGTPSPRNTPGGRDAATSWTDSTGNLWLFGGDSIEGYLNDLWEYQPATKEWAWMAGSSTVPSRGGLPGLYGYPGMPAAGNNPGSRQGAAPWTDNSGHLWLFGGEGYDAAAVIGDLNDLWEYQPTVASSSAKVTPGVTLTLSAPSITLARPQALTVSVIVRGTPKPTGSITLAGGGYISTPSALRNGGAIIEIPAASLAAGRDTLTARYTPDSASFSRYNSASGSNVVTVNKQTSSTTLIASPNPSSLGQLVTFTATVTGERGGTATGTVTFSDGDTPLGTVPVYGSAVFTITALPQDTNSIRAVYNGDSHFYGGTSNEVSQAVEAEVLHDWTWMGGSSTVGSKGGQPGLYGLIGTTAIGDVPSGRNGAASWSDSFGHLWLFGGEGNDANGVMGYPNDLWEFNPRTNEWTWKSGSSTVPCSDCAATGLEGDLGKASGFYPGGRAGSSSWMDEAGHLWLFGGVNLGDASGGGIHFSDLWEFDPTTNQWAWMSGFFGDPPCTTGTLGASGFDCGFAGAYGTEGTPAAENIPGSRNDAMSWTDGHGHFWLFGGLGYDRAGEFGYLNDLWEFDTSTKDWTWMGGGQSLMFLPGAEGPYFQMPGDWGTLGKPASTNVPSGREGAITWTDLSGSFWLYGGVVPTVRGGWYGLSDLWEFDLSTKEWTWMGGSSTATDQAGVYGKLGTPAAGNTPGGRAFASSWTDGGGNLWLFGGNGYGANCNSCERSDLWEFNSSTHLWAWMGGNSTAGNTPGVYGNAGTPAAQNLPGSRSFATSWTDGSGNLWLFGGNGYDAKGASGYLNDMWEYQPSETTTPAKTDTTITLTLGPNPSTYKEPVTLIATVFSTAGAPPNEEIVTFMSDARMLGTAPMTSGVASLTTTALPAGTDSITAVYRGDTNLADSTSSAASVVVRKAAPTINWATPAAIVYGTALSTKQLDAKASVAGSFSYSPAEGAVLDAGSQKLSVTFEPTETIDYGNTSASVTLTVQRATPKIALSRSPGSSKLGTTVTCTATLSGSGSLPAGAVSFYDGKTRLGAGTLSAAGVATYSTDKLTVGTHSITASYDGGKNYLAAVSASVSVVVSAD